MPDSESANFPPLISREQAGNVIARALRLYVGRGRHYSVKQLSNGSGVKDRMIECAMCATDSVDYRPLPEWALLSIMAFLGPCFTSEVLAPAHQRALDANAADDEPVAKLEAVRASLIELAERIAA